MATTLPAPPEKVWPWLVQMGGDRAGFYSWDRLDHHREPSADRIVPEWQHLQQGQPLMGAVGLVLLQPLHFIMQTRQFRNLRARVSAQARGLS